MSATDTIFDMEHPGIVMVHSMRERGLHDDEIRAQLTKAELALQQDVNGGYIGKHIPRIPTQDEIDTLRTLEVASVYSSIFDLSSSGAMEKIAKVQAGLNPYFNGSTMSAQWQKRRDNHLATQKPKAKRHTTILAFTR
jgi:hypothetical protein